MGMIDSVVIGIDKDGDESTTITDSVDQRTYTVKSVNVHARHAQLAQDIQGIQRSIDQGSITNADTKQLNDMLSKSQEEFSKLSEIVVLYNQAKGL